MNLNDVISLNTTTELSELKDSLHTELSDVQLWNMIRKDDAEAMVKLYKRHYPILYSYGLKTCHDKDLTKDSIQEVFTGIWSSRQNLNQVKKVRSYLLQSLWNRLVKELKKNAKSGDLESSSVYQTETIFSIEQELVAADRQNEKLRKLNQSMAALSKKQREIIFMLFYEGMSYKEIAEQKSVNYQSVKNLAHKTMNKLREMVLSLMLFLSFAFSFSPEK